MALSQAKYICSALKQKKFTLTGECEDCHTANAADWLCVSGEHTMCHEVFCRADAGKHRSKRNHQLFLNVKSHLYWCFECDSKYKWGGMNVLGKFQRLVVAHTLDKGIAGLPNLGNTCYMNASIQALSSCLPVRRFF